MNGTWTSTKSVERYQDAANAHAREVIGRLKIGGKSGERKRSV